MTGQVVIVTGLSGAGKSTAIRCFEDLGFFCIDNLPPALIPRFLELSLHNEDVHRIALGIDIRERGFLKDFFEVYEGLKRHSFDVRLVYLEARDEVLIRRFSETRRKHPLAEGRPLTEAIKTEREKLLPIRDIADTIVDSSEQTIHQLKDHIITLFLSTPRKEAMNLTLISFGYRHGIPSEADLVFDVRFLPNPHFVEELAPLTGFDERVRAFMMDREVTGEFLDRLKGFLDFLVPQYLAEGKAYLTLAVGCTGGQHRSVVVVNLLKDYFTQQGLPVVAIHRELIGR
jgi:UPF0042 nucleotide-binding protein